MCDAAPRNAVVARLDQTLAAHPGEPLGLMIAAVEFRGAGRDNCGDGNSRGEGYGGQEGHGGHGEHCGHESHSGHGAGGCALAELAGRLQRAAGPTAEVDPLGADRFAVTVRGLRGPRLAMLGDRVLEGLGGSVVVGHSSVPLTVSIGVALAGSGGGGAELFERAQVAMCWAGRGGVGSVVHLDGDSERELSEPLGAVPTE